MISTPDGRYFVVKGQLWRCTNPALDEDTRQRLVNALMDARRAVKAAKASGDPHQLRVARHQVHGAKVADSTWVAKQLRACRAPVRSLNHWKHYKRQRRAFRSRRLSGEPLH